MNFKRWTVGKKLWFLAIVSASVLFGVEIFYETNSAKLVGDLSRFSKSNLPAVRNMTLADMMHDGLRAVVYRSIIAVYTKDSQELAAAKEEYGEMAKNILVYLGEIAKAKLGNQIDEDVSHATESVKMYVQAGQAVLALAEAGDLDAAMKKLPAYQEAFKALEEKLETLGDRIEKKIAEDVELSERGAEKTEFWGKFIAILGSALGLLFSVWINIDLVKNLRSMVGGLRTQGVALRGYSDEVGLSAQSLSSSSTQQAAAVQETAAAIEEINAMVAKTAENSQRLAKSSQSSGDVVEAGRTAVGQMLSEMETIKQSNASVMQQIEQSNTQIKGIVQVIGEIGEKTKVINDIVFQTKLLSFNASVEAARAGEHGKGFAVVAEEVGNLAQMSGTAAKDITQMLENGMRQVSEIVDTNRARISALMEESARKVENGKRVADQCGEVFGKIVEQVGEVSRLSSEITTAIDEQRTGLEEINKAIGLFSESTQANSATANNTSEVSQHLQESVKELSHVMGELEFLVNGVRQTLADSPNSELPPKNVVKMDAEQRLAS